MEPVPYDKRNGKIWFNGQIVDWKDAKLHVLTHGLHYGSCVFEGERVYNGEIFKLRQHTDRLIYSAKRMGFEIPYTAEEIDNACNEIIKIQNVKNGYVRQVAWRGSEMMALMLDHEDYVAEATGANIFFVDEKLKEIHTPIPDCFLDGITRRTIIDIAKKKGFKINERKIKLNELTNFDACFLTGTAAEVTPVSQIGEYKFKVTSSISEFFDKYLEIVNKKVTV